ncbi:TetR/AcrR family transcriptional regulator [Anoxynatronum buryatiense]|uniref:Transcriptional regulator, TetR family n=1 Tax=Anoxynatronum buryatiense TaxID=489973 RepID=A0AA45WYG1_9CLOT|nr:TetR/AcrR family transcriptional regulator [Anoxynatronum buryatiense]SMP68755.1 transcriptional regulator, TetR family [Anoxynatronum buryatiense]
MELNREKIVQAAINQFNTQGIQGASISAIAAEAGISKGTLYYYYQSKDSLIHDCFSIVKQNAKEITFLHLDMSLPPEQLIREFVHASFRWPLTYPEQLRFMDSYISLYFYEKKAYSLFLFDMLCEENVTPAMRNALRDDLPLELLNFLVGKTLTHVCKYAIACPEFINNEAYIKASAEMIWNMIKK